MPALIATLAQIGALILKELLAIIKEPSSRVILFAPALMQRCCSATAPPTT